MKTDVWFASNIFIKNTAENKNFENEWQTHLSVMRVEKWRLLKRWRCLSIVLVFKIAKKRKIVCFFLYGKTHWWIQMTITKKLVTWTKSDAFGHLAGTQALWTSYMRPCGAVDYFIPAKQDWLTRPAKPAVRDLKTTVARSQRQWKRRNRVLHLTARLPAHSAVQKPFFLPKTNVDNRLQNRTRLKLPDHRLRARLTPIYSLQSRNKCFNFFFWPLLRKKVQLIWFNSRFSVLFPNRTYWEPPGTRRVISLRDSISSTTKTTVITSIPSRGQKMVTHTWLDAHGSLAHR